MTERKKYIAGWGYQIYKRYVRFLNNRLMFRHVWYIDRENLPPLGEPCMVVSNHQNCANDPLNLLLGFDNRAHAYVIARANVFNWSPVISNFFQWLGMVPAFRLDYEGAETLAKNEETIRITGGKMIDGNCLIVYPEGTHYDKHWLGDFSYGYTRLAFQTAEHDNFQHDIKIVPSANHYSDYFGVQEDVMIRFGTPVSLAPFYELYKTKPRTAQREVNKQIRKQIEDMMLDIRDLEHYDEIDWIRNSELGYEYCTALGLNPKYLPDKLQSDKQLVSLLEEWKDWQAVSRLREEENKLGVKDTDINKQTGWCVTLLSMLAQIFLLPLWIVTLYPNIFHYNIQRLFLRKDKMFTNSWRFIVPTVVGVPFFFLLTVLVCGFAWGLWWQSVLWMLLVTYPLSLFAFYEWEWMKQTWKNLRMLCIKNKLVELNDMRFQLFERIRKTINTK